MSCSCTDINNCPDYIRKRLDRAKEIIAEVIIKEMEI